jgi:negative regulator of replication initiation
MFFQSMRWMLEGEQTAPKELIPKQPLAVLFQNNYKRKNAKESIHIPRAGPGY